MRQLVTIKACRKEGTLRSLLIAPKPHSLPPRMLCFDQRIFAAIITSSGTSCSFRAHRSTLHRRQSMSRMPWVLDDATEQLLPLPGEQVFEFLDLVLSCSALGPQLSDCAVLGLQRQFHATL